MGNYSDSYTSITKKIKYLEDHLKKKNSTYLQNKLTKIVKENTIFSKEIDKLYNSIRKKEKKIPSLISPNSQFLKSYTSNNTTKSFPSISLNESLENSLEVKEAYERITLYLGGSDLVSYSNVIKNHIGERVDINEEDMSGYLFFNSALFNKFDIPKKIDTGSDMKNISKGFFKYNNKNHVALVQYLGSGGSSKEHYHSLPEIIIQLAGETHVELRDVDNDLDVKYEGLRSGDLLVIPPKTIHKLVAYDGGSITIPIKQTNKNRSDHFYQEMSPERLTKEIDDLIRIPHYNSGTEILSELIDFHNGLKVSEKDNFSNYLDSKLKNEKNLNIKKIIEECKKKI